MTKFSEISLKRLATCHQDLQVIFNIVIDHFDCVVLEGHRGKEDQEKAFKAGKSQNHWPDGKHNSMPSMAVDVAPYDTLLKVNWDNTRRFYYFGGFVMGVAKMLKLQGKITHTVRYGGDWDQDTEVTDQKFNDLVHFELV